MAQRSCRWLHTSHHPPAAGIVYALAAGARDDVRVVRAIELGFAVLAARVNSPVRPGSLWDYPGATVSAPSTPGDHSSVKASTSFAVAKNKRPLATIGVWNFAVRPEMRFMPVKTGVPSSPL
jgi:hypothetical protein